MVFTNRSRYYTTAFRVARGSMFWLKIIVVVSIILPVFACSDKTDSASNDSDMETDSSTDTLEDTHMDTNTTLDTIISQDSNTTSDSDSTEHGDESDSDWIDNLLHSECTSFTSDITVANWQGDKKAALSFVLFDSTPGQALHGIAAMCARKLVASWFVNPGGEYYQAYWKNRVSSCEASRWNHTTPPTECGTATWEQLLLVCDQELANHTMNHQGAASAAQAAVEVAEAAKEIWRLRDEVEFSSLMAFCSAGSTTWPANDVMEPILRDNLNVEYRRNPGVSVLAHSIPIGSDATTLWGILPQVIEDGLWGKVNFHGICFPSINPVEGASVCGSAVASEYRDYGNGAVNLDEFESFLDQIVVEVEAGNLWVGGWIQVYKYAKERLAANISIEQACQNRIYLDLTADVDTSDIANVHFTDEDLITLYNEPLTLVLNVPQTWNEISVFQGDIEKRYPVVGGIGKIDVLPNREKILVVENK